jgi:hypothetical protein
VESHATAYNCYAVVTQLSESLTNAQMDFGIMGLADGQLHNGNVSPRQDQRHRKEHAVIPACNSLCMSADDRT